MAQAKKTEPNFHVIKMSKEDFFGSKELEKGITNRKVAKNKEKFSWLNTQNIINNRDNPFEIKIEKYGTSPPIQVSLRKKGKLGKSTTSFSNYSLIPLYTTHRPIKRKKYDDLMKLLQYIPTQYHAFYKQLHSDCEDKTKKRRKTALDSSDDEMNGDNEN